jgi:acetyl esterase/lipase
MSYLVDPEISTALLAVADLVGRYPAAARGDWRTRRANSHSMMTEWSKLAVSPQGITTKTFSIRSHDGAEIALRWYASDRPAPGSAIVYAHGGGMIFGTMDLNDSLVSEYVHASGVPFLSVDYRLAPEAHGESLVRDTFAALLWLTEHAGEFGVDPSRIAVMGNSAGGGIAAGVAILARDNAVRLARQILIYPMLDDRNLTPDPHFGPYLTWTYDDNYTGWHALLGEMLGRDSVSHLAVPSRLVDCSGLAPAYIDVGELDIFRDEDIAYAQKLAAAGVSVELHVYPGLPHGFELLAPTSRAALIALTARANAIRSV